MPVSGPDYVERTPALDWQPLAQSDSGHRWEGGYRFDTLVVVRCADCGIAPMAALRTNLTFDPCRSSSDAP